MYTKAAFSPEQTGPGFNSENMKVLQQFIRILLHKEICYHKVITEHLAINMESVHDRMMATMFLKKGLDEIEQEGHKHTRTEKERDKRMIMNAPWFRSVQMFECYKCLQFSPSPPGFCASRPVRNRNDEPRLGSAPGCAACYNLIR